MLLGGALLASPLSAHAAAEGEVFVPQPDIDLPALIQAVRDHSPVLQDEHLQVELAAADLRQSRLVENPVLDGAVGTIPVSTPNPPDLPNPLSNIPNYGVGLSLHPALGRRGPRIAQSAALLDAAEARRRFATRAEALRLLRTLGDMATAILRLSANQRLAVQSRGALHIARERVRTGFGPPLDADRAEIELLRIEQQVAADQGDLLAAQAACASVVGMRCGAFDGEATARRFLDVWIGRSETVPTQLEDRKDLVALLMQKRAALAEERLAYAQLIPDPTLRFGYLYDRFVASGNQQHSVSVSLSLPLPLFDHGQAAAQAARSRQHRLDTHRSLLYTAGQAKILSLRQALLVGRQRLGVLQEQVLPRVQAILRNVTRAFEARAVPLTDVIQAQRSLDELLLQEASALGDVFRLSADLIEEGPEHE